MKVSRLLVPLLLLVASPAMALTDSQVITYIQTQAAAGKSQDQIGKELLAKGVTPEQIKRIKAQYEKSQKGGNKSGSSKKSGSSGSRLRSKSKNSKKGVSAYNMDDEDLFGNVDFEDDRQMTDSVSLFKDSEIDEEPEKIIYGHDVFSSTELSFEPNVNMATPQNYRLGPGDEVIIDIWGASEDNLREEISPDGQIVISQIGPVYLNGMTIAEANKHVKNIFARKYAGVGTETDVNLTLGNIRSIQVDVMGEVNTPGSFRLSPFSNVFHAIYSAGGINEIGTLRNIQVMRNGKVISKLDLYDYLFKGKDTGNVRLQEGDVIIVSPYAELINVAGNVKRPMYYELKPTESLSKLLEYAGGFAGNAYSDVVKVERLNGSEKIVYTVEKSQFPSFTLVDGDEVTVGEVTDKYSNKIELKGAVNRPGIYAISNNLRTVRELINRADGLAEDAYLERALIYREQPDRSLQILSINIGDLMNGAIADITLNRNDIIEISSVNDITERGPLSIYGYIAIPGEYQYAVGTTVEDLILRAGGLLEGASTARVEVARRVVDPSATTPSDQIAQMFTFGLGDDETDSRYKNFTLMPYDIVHIRKSPSYRKQEFVKVSGELLFPGEYALQNRNERVSEVVKRSGGLLDGAYVKGAYLKRKMNEEQKKKQLESVKKAMDEARKGISDTKLMATQQLQDSIKLAEFETSEFYNVGIDLEKAIDNPGSTYDFVLRDGDELVVPELQSTVEISGEVLFPNTVVYVPGKKLKYYVDQAGGYGEDAKKSKAFIVYMNGSVTKAKGSSIIEPGCHIIVPTKNTAKFDWTPIFSITSTLGSLATLAATVAALIR